MTVQDADILIDNYGLDIGGLYLYGVSAPLPEDPVISANHRCSANNRGYVATFQIDSDGTFNLIQFANIAEVPRIQPVPNGRFWGNFEITLRPFFLGPSTKIPFKNGIVVNDKNYWVRKNAPICGWNIQRRNSVGYTVDTDAGTVWLPLSLIPDDIVKLLEQEHNGTVECLLREYDYEKKWFEAELLRLC